MAKKSASRSATSAAKKSAEPTSSRPYAPGYGFPKSDDKKGMLPWSWVAKKLSPCHTFWLATIHDHDGRPHIMPIWGVWLEDAFFFSTASKSRKGRNLGANPLCTITNDDGREAVIVEASASELHDAAVLERVVAAYKRKYKMDPTDMKEPIFVARPRTVYAFIEKSFPKTASRWKF